MLSFVGLFEIEVVKNKKLIQIMELGRSLQRGRKEGKERKNRNSEWNGLPKGLWRLPYLS
jgi:hypothetical protein